MESVSSNVAALQQNRQHSRTMRLDILPDAVSAGVAPTRTRHATARVGFHLTEQELQSLFQNGYDAMLITDMAGSILQGNHRSHEFLCANGRTLSGINVTTLISGAEPSLVGKLVQALETERYVRIHAWCSSGDGTFFPAEIAVYRSQAGISRHLCFFIRDITWRKEAEDRLQMVDTAMRTARAGIAMVDTEGVVTYANPAMNALCGIPAGQNLTGRRIADFFEAIYGVDNLDGASKLTRGHDLVRDLTLSTSTCELFFIGDTLHDVEVARELGARCILVDSGHQTAERLATAGVPVAPTLTDAVRLILDEA